MLLVVTIYLKSFVLIWNHAPQVSNLSHVEPLTSRSDAGRGVHTVPLFFAVLMISELLNLMYLVQLCPTHHTSRATVIRIDHNVCVARKRTVFLKVTFSASIMYIYVYLCHHTHKCELR